MWEKIKEKQEELESDNSEDVIDKIFTVIFIHRFIIIIGGNYTH